MEKAIDRGQLPLAVPLIWPPREATMSTSKENQNRPESKPEITIAPPPPGKGETLSDKDLDQVSGGINPQPLPPRHD